MKQQCVLSPLLFALDISSLGNVLHSMQEGVEFGGLVTFPPNPRASSFRYNNSRFTLLISVFASVMRSGEDPWAKSVQDLDPAGSGLFRKPKSEVQRTLLQAAIQTVTAKKREHISLRYMPLPTNWFKLQPHVTDSQSSRLLCRVRAGDVGLGNRRPNDFGKSYKLCPFCLQNGSSVALNEAHAIRTVQQKTHGTS